MKTIIDISYTNSDLFSQKLDLYLPDNSIFPTFIFFHGGGLIKGDKSDVAKLARYFTNRGICFVSANYRMYPDAKFPDFIEDGAATVAWVKNNIVNYGGNDTVFVGGSSAGGYISMMLCYDSKYLTKHSIAPTDIAAYVHDAGQPSTHYSVMAERGFDQRKCAADDAAPLYHIGDAKDYSPQLIFVSDNDIKGRYEQTLLLIATLEAFGYDTSKVKLQIMKGYTHTQYLSQFDETKNTVFADIIYEFLSDYIKE